MAHYAFLDSNNIVTEVITGIDETELIEVQKNGMETFVGRSAFVLPIMETFVVSMLALVTLTMK